MEEFQKYFFQTTFHHHFQARNAKISPIFHFDRGHNRRICHILCVKILLNIANIFSPTLQIIRIHFELYFYFQRSKPDNRNASSVGRYGISETFIFCFQPQTPFELLETTHINSISYFQTSKRAKRTTKYSIKRGLIAKFLYKRSFTIYSGSHGTTN